MTFPDFSKAPAKQDFTSRTHIGNLDKNTINKKSTSPFKKSVWYVTINTNQTEESFKRMGRNMQEEAVKLGDSLDQMFSRQSMLKLLAPVLTKGGHDTRLTEIVGCDAESDVEVGAQGKLHAHGLITLTHKLHSQFYIRYPRVKHFIETAMKLRMHVYFVKVRDNVSNLRDYLKKNKIENYLENKPVDVENEEEIVLEEGKKEDPLGPFPVVETTEGPIILFDEDSMPVPLSDTNKAEEKEK